ncbi:uncharacterized protein LOC141637813 [Silene latifolia]|uniref:uncharacterized protein LOC141637813 n=1 Tax=Silene latifolia TaxID=37657 RepID=UPI003D781FF0
MCRNFLRIDRGTFGVLLEMIRDVGGQSGTKNMRLEEIGVGFLYTVAQHKKKNRMIGAYFYRSGESVNRQFHACLKAILKLHVVLLKKPSPIAEDCEDDRWKYFKNCLGALDGTMIYVNVPTADQSKYRIRKGNLTTNVLGVCSVEMEFIYVLLGWEGSAHDGRILRDAISRPNGLKVPKGYYYLCDGYTNGDRFLASFRGHLYHLKEWNSGPHRPQTAEEYFNLSYPQARNVIGRCFGLLKGRWGILRSPSWFSLQTHGRIVLACALLHNLVKRYMSPESSDDDELYEEIESDGDESDDDDDDELEYISPLMMDESTASGCAIGVASGGTSEGGRGKNKRFWTKEEDNVLVAALSDMNVDPH